MSQNIVPSHEDVIKFLVALAQIRLENLLHEGRDRQLIVTIEVNLPRDLVEDDFVCLQQLVATRRVVDTAGVCWHAPLEGHGEHLRWRRACQLILNLDRLHIRTE